MRSRRSLVALIAAMLLGIAAVSPAAAAREFGTIYVDGAAYRTFGNPANVAPGTGTDPIIAFTNFDQGGVAQFAPGGGSPSDPRDGSHGGRWQVWMATWVDPTEARLLTDFDEVIGLVNAGDLTLERAEEADFRCPILPPGQDV
jgi:hypothetical protein